MERILCGGTEFEISGSLVERKVSILHLPAILDRSRSTLLFLG